MGKPWFQSGLRNFPNCSTSPGNDPLVADVPREPPDVVVDAVLAQLESEAFEVYVPEWFGPIAAGKAGNLDGFLAGSAAYLAAREEARGAR